MPQFYSVQGHEALKHKLDQIAAADGKHCDDDGSAATAEAPSRTFIFFVGSKLPETGESWCPDCAKAEPNVKQALQEEDLQKQQNINFITCDVGFRAEWKNPDNPVKNDPSLSVNSIPTLARYSVAESRTLRKLEKDADFEQVSQIKTFLLQQQ